MSTTGQIFQFPHDPVSLSPAVKRHRGKKADQHKIIHDNLRKEVSFGVQTHIVDRKWANLKPDARGRKGSGSGLQSFHQSYSSQGPGPDSLSCSAALN